MAIETTETPAPASSANPKKSGSAGRWLIEWAIILVLVVGFTFVLRTFVIQTFSIPSGSMLPTLHVGDRIIVNKLSYDFHGVHRGDIVVFKRPPLESQNYSDLVKRVVGLPGETISSVNGTVYINGKPLVVSWLPSGPQAFTGPLASDAHPEFNMPGPVKIPAGDYYVMGDNRTDSEDSRFFGPIPKSLIVGRAVAVVWPVSRIKGL
ncbi:MAG TPA: signal peptidase I [Acidimicrobiales bacterium]|nr:signal peptidase I [Acidimicrobiales bacterium]